MNKRKPSKTETKVLSSTNPQVVKGDGDEFVQTYIQAMPTWKKEVGIKLDKIAQKIIPEVQLAVRWNTPFYGTKKFNWFFGFYCYEKYVQVFFLNGSMLKPMPPEESKQKNVRYLNIFENDEIDFDQISEWIKQGSQLPGDKVF
jgi:hypothetical protein